MAGEVVTLGSDDALLEDDFEGGRRPRRGKAKVKKRRKLSEKKKSRSAKRNAKRSHAIHRAMTGGKRQ